MRINDPAVTGIETVHVRDDATVMHTSDKRRAKQLATTLIERRKDFTASAFIDEGDTGYEFIVYETNERGGLYAN